MTWAFRRGRYCAVRNANDRQVGNSLDEQLNTCTLRACTRNWCKSVDKRACSTEKEEMKAYVAPQLQLQEPSAALFLGGDSHAQFG
jgi:hypothetical protein